ncbi:MAG: DNA-directed RNA polymerase subunit omega [Clostridia bacterium]|nr:DNA-directed RNA polymerase subunit omega [Clostridia bacterium]
MIYPPITELVKKTGSRYALVIETAKRTRQLVDGAERLSNVETFKDVTVAVNEIFEGKVEAVKTVENSESGEASLQSEEQLNS